MGQGVDHSSAWNGSANELIYENKVSIKTLLSKSWSYFLDPSLSHPNERSQRHWSSLNKHGNLRKCSNLRINKNPKKKLSLMKESIKEALQVTELERHFYYWNLIYDYCLIFIIWVLLYRNEEQCWDLWATLLNCQDREDSNKQTTLPTSKYVGKTEIQNSVEGQKHVKTNQDRWWIFQVLYIRLGAFIQSLLLTGGKISISTKVKIKF